MERKDLLASLREKGFGIAELANKTEEELTQMAEEFANHDKYGRWIDPDAFDSYKVRFKDSVAKHGFESAYLMWSAGDACGCMGPQGNEPHCPCMMRCKTAAMFGKIVQIEPE